MSERWDWRGIWTGVPQVEKRALYFLFLVLAFALLWSITGWIKRYDFSEALVPFTFQEERIEPIREEEVHYRTYLIEAPVRISYEVYAADILLPTLRSYGTGWVLSIVAWAALLGAITRAEGIGVYAVYFAWAAWVFLGGSAKAWANTDPFYIVSLGLTLAILLPVYLIGAGFWRLRVGMSALLVSALIAFFTGFPAFWKGSSLLYESISYPTPLTYAASGIMALQVPTALLTALAYPLPLRRSRNAGLWFFPTVGGGLILLLLLLPAESAYALTVLLVGIGIIVGFVGLQPYYPILGSGLRHPAAFFWAWGGLSLLSIATFGYHAWNHQDIYLYRVVELWRSMLIGGLAGMTLYLLWNFFPLWRSGRVEYWELARSVRLPLAVVYFMSLVAVIFSEARNDWPSTRLPARLYSVTRAEAALLRGEWDTAEALYREASYILPYEAKLNYNLGRLEAQQKEAVESAAERYERSLLSKPFQPALLQASVIWLALDRPVRALQLLQRYKERFGADWRIYNQLAFGFYKIGQLDSAAYYWKAAIREAPYQSQPYAHLALLYAQYEKPNWAATVAQHIASWKNLPPSVQENLAYLRLRGFLQDGKFAGWNAQWLGQDADTSAVGRFVSALRQEALQKALSFLPYFRENDPELAPKLTRQVGIALLRAGSPRRAAEVFLEAGTPIDSLYAGYALAESQCWDMAYALISRLWGSYPAIEEAARREVALLLTAAGRAQEATFIDPPQNWKDEDYLRFGYYAYLRGDLQTMVVVLRPWIEQGAAYDAPYEWVARLFLRQGDTAGAYENIQAGLQRVPQSLRLHLLNAEISAIQGKSLQAEAILDSSRRYLRSPMDTLEWYALRLRFYPDTSALHRLIQQYPHYAPLAELWADHLLRRERYSEVYAYLTDLLEVHSDALRLWRLYGQAAEALGMIEEAEFARKKPDPCPSVL